MDKVIIGLMVALVAGVFSILAVVVKIWFDRHIETIKSDYQKELAALTADLKEAKDVRINRTTTVNARKIKAQETLFHKLEELTLVTDSTELLSQMEAVKIFIRKHSLLIDEPYRIIAIDLFDYFTLVARSVENKKVEKEDALFARYIQEFNK